MSEHSWSWTVHTSLPSQNGAHEPCMHEVLAQLEAAGLGGPRSVRRRDGTRRIADQRDAPRQSARPKKKVDVECKASPERFWLRVQDEGPGFQPGAVPDCTADENLERCGGRGLALIKAYMTHVEYNDCGNCVTMEKFRTTGP